MGVNVGIKEGISWTPQLIEGVNKTSETTRQRGLRCREPAKAHRKSRACACTEGWGSKKKSTRNDRKLEGGEVAVGLAPVRNKERVRHKRTGKAKGGNQDMAAPTPILATPHPQTKKNPNKKNPPKTPEKPAKHQSPNPTPKKKTNPTGPHPDAKTRAHDTTPAPTKPRPKRATHNKKPRSHSRTMRETVGTLRVVEFDGG